MRWRVRRAGDAVAGADRGAFGRGPGTPRDPSTQADRRQAFRSRVGYPCVHCGLPVRLTGAHDHPGRAVVDHEGGVAGVTEGGLPNLQLRHRFCNDPPPDPGGLASSGMALRRARLGWATERYDEGDPSAGGDLTLGLPRGTALYQKYWRVRTMRYAIKACRYYGRSH
ncbi:hypothetical protein F0L68_02220 [Solihabitans fulvus]|uniref:Uncharacterized protein n=1 Tax=Solihabitans fulvus TaxID=1892852 RepID=A0A5B2XT90_9PSEU|nr:hypothetical protein [Solihabitans fulvus]KAA2266573.1 hypothetical protein F0L68_02220 [Solihabitans fulvus]